MILPPRQKERCLQVHVHDLIPVLLAEVECIGAPDRARIVDEDVDGPEIRLNLAHDALQIGLGAEICRMPMEAAAQRRDRARRL
jgi:hypothetical protein